MYPGLAEYAEPGKQPFRIFLNESTIRKMDPTFAGRPVFVRHVENVDENVDEVKLVADGWVVESFYNQADGKHWVKFITVSERAAEAIRQGWRLSNCYVPKGPYGSGGLWNGVSYDHEIKDGEYEHLAIVNDPRYEESIILTPEQFKEHNSQKLEELKKLSNEKEPKGMKLNFFKRTKIENELDLENMLVILPKSKKEMSLSALVNSMDDMEVLSKEEKQMANVGHYVKLGEEEMTVDELVKKYQELCAAKTENEVEEEEVVEEELEPVYENEVEEEEKKEKEVEEIKRKENATKKANALRNAHKNPPKEARVEISMDQVARGKTRYGS